MTSRPLASPRVDVQSFGARPQRPWSAAGMLTVAAGCSVEAAGAFAGGAPEASGTESLIVGRPAVFLALSSTGALPAAEAVIANRHRNRHVDADHADIDAGGEFARGVAVAGEDRDAVAIFVLRRKPHRFLEILRPDHLQDRPENLVLVGLHVGRDPIEEGGADEEALLMPLKREAAAVDHQLGALVDAHLDVMLDPLLVRLA